MTKHNLMCHSLQTMSIIMGSLDDASFRAKDTPEAAMVFARNFTCFSESLFLIQDGLQTCEKELTAIVDKLYQQIGEVQI